MVQQKDLFLNQLNTCVIIGLQLLVESRFDNIRILQKKNTKYEKRNEFYP